MSIKAAAKFKAILSVRFLADKRLNSVFEALIIYPSKARVKQGVNVVDDRKHWPQMLNRQETSRFATDQEPVKSRRESERRPTQEMTGDLKRAGRLCNKAQQLSSFESEQEHGFGSLPQELKVDMQVPSAHSAKKGKRFWRRMLPSTALPL
ncbi:hypothetical protein CAPTEDRAFT_191644 [Capitella teleta]|uniref:Uncharacterized protein n=1 Tax=Capitella teleta TaxID=283909 RepID=R7VL54_CAPTE|nr:hypothetical protein CAPTEDRAFT_191644 [Capitella teleta]|eukprot:ELU17971.1 hypothetical protein CAPTEDRAFT_191644 [Capitella teleta]